MDQCRSRNGTGVERGYTIDKRRGRDSRGVEGGVDLPDP